MKRALVAKWPRRLLGIVMFFASLAFLTHTLARLDPVGRMTLLDRAAHSELVLLSVGYGASLILLARAWAAIADPDRCLPRSHLISIYGRSALAKYVPGAVLQYGARQWLGVQAGLRQGPLARASVVEIGLHLLLATAIVLIAGAACGLAPAALGIVSAIALLGQVALAHRAEQRALLAATMWQTGFFALFWLFSMLTAWMVVGDAAAAIKLATIFLAGWLAGFVLPFVPGGLGVREATIVALGGGLADPATLLAFAGLTRLMTLGGDLALGLASYLFSMLDDRLNKQAPTRQ